MLHAWLEFRMRCLIHDVVVVLAATREEAVRVLRFYTRFLCYVKRTPDEVEAIHKCLTTNTIFYARKLVFSETVKFELQFEERRDVDFSTINSGN